MKAKRILGALCALCMTGVLAGCGAGSGSESSTALTTRIIYMTDEASTTASSAGEEETNEAKEIPAGMYISEMTGEPISEDIRDQRPIAVMIDNEMYALDHFGTAECDVVYEMMNSTANNRITRLMVMVKDWGAIKQLGSIRSTRPTNLLLFPEWDSVLCHDGGPAVHIDPYFANDYTPHFNGFPRVNNGKAVEFTEYVIEGSVESWFNNTGVSSEYTQYKPERDTHFLFVPWGTKLDLEEKYGETFDAEEIDLSGAFPHNGSRLVYNEETEMYEYHEYGAPHKDGEDGEILSFKNVFLQDVSFNELDANGYMIYNILTSEYNKAYYVTEGKGIEVFWTKPGTTELTKFYTYGATGVLEEIQINTGKTYIGLIPSDSWDSVDFR